MNECLFLYYSMPLPYIFLGGSDDAADKTDPILTLQLLELSGLLIADTVCLKSYQQLLLSQRYSLSSTFSAEGFHPIS